MIRSRSRQPDFLGQRAGAGAPLGQRELSMRLERLHDLVADPDHRIERRHRLLEDHRDPPPAQRPPFRRRQFQQIASLETDRARDRSNFVRQQAHHGRGANRSCRSRIRRRRKGSAAGAARARRFRRQRRGRRRRAAPASAARSRKSRPPPSRSCCPTRHHHFVPSLVTPPAQCRPCDGPTRRYITPLLAIDLHRLETAERLVRPGHPMPARRSDRRRPRATPSVPAAACRQRQNCAARRRIAGCRGRGRARRSGSAYVRSA